MGEIQSFYNGVQDWSLYKFTKAKGRTCVRNNFLRTTGLSIEKGLSVVVSDTNLKQKYHDLYERALSAGYEFEITNNFEEAWKR